MSREDQLGELLRRCRAVLFIDGDGADKIGRVTVNGKEI